MYRERQSLSLTWSKSSSILFPCFCDKENIKKKHVTLEQAPLSSRRGETQGLLWGRLFCLRGVPLGTHLLLLFFLGQGFVAAFSLYLFLLLFLLGLGFESFYFSSFLLNILESRTLSFSFFFFFFFGQGFVASLSSYPFFLLGLGLESVFFSPQNTRAIRILGFQNFVSSKVYFLPKIFQGLNFLNNGFSGISVEEKLGGRLPKGGCSGTRATPNRGNIAIGSS